jgi:hypothetical protein
MTAAEEITTEQQAEEEPANNSRITKESILQGAIDDIDKLEKNVKSSKTLVDLLVIHKDMPLTLTSIELQLKIFKMMLQHENILANHIH